MTSDDQFHVIRDKDWTRRHRPVSHNTGQRRPSERINADIQVITTACQQETSVDVVTAAKRLQPSRAIHQIYDDRPQLQKSMINVVVAAAFDRSKSSMHFRNLKPPSRTAILDLCVVSADRARLFSRPDWHMKMRH